MKQLATAIEDQWSDVLGEQSEIVDTMPDGWDSAKTFAARHHRSPRQAATILSDLVASGDAERKLIRLPKHCSAFYIYRRILTSGKVI